MIPATYFRNILMSSWIIFTILQTISYLWQPYHYFPSFGFFGYTITILLALISLNYAYQQWHYVIQSFTLIFFGLIASLDIIWSKQEILDAFTQLGWHSLMKIQIDGYIQVLLVMLNIFTGSFAANGLFYGLNRKNFKNNF